MEINNVDIPLSLNNMWKGKLQNQEDIHPIKSVICGLGYRGKQLARLLSQMQVYHLIGGYDPSPDESFTFSVASGDDADFARLLNTLHPELVFITSPWQHHVRQAIIALEAGCHVALEIRGGLIENEYLPLMTLMQRTGKHVFPLENTLFLQQNMAAVNAINDGLLGEIVSMRGGYRHDLRDLLIELSTESGQAQLHERSWRTRYYRLPDADIYPTHGVAPLAVMIGINHRDRFKEITAVRSKAAGIHSRFNISGENHDFIGDIILTNILTDNGVLITLTHDTTLPRPRSLDFEVQGTKGLWKLDEGKIYVEHRSPFETWEDDDRYVRQYESSIWRKWRATALQLDSHHKGMDFVMLQSIAEDLRGGTAYPVNLKDLITWTSLTFLSRRSIQEKRTITDV